MRIRRFIHNAAAVLLTAVLAIQVGFGVNDTTAKGADTTKVPDLAQTAQNAGTAATLSVVDAKSQTENTESENNGYDTLALNKKSLTLRPGEEAVIKIKAGEQKFSGWILSERDIVSASEDGKNLKIKALRPGNMQVTAVSYGWGEEAVCNIEVTEPEQYRFPVRKLTLVEGERTELTMPAEVTTKMYPAVYQGYIIEAEKNEWMQNVFTIEALYEGSTMLYADFYSASVPGNTGAETDNGLLYGDVITVEVLSKGIAHKSAQIVAGDETVLATAGMMENMPVTWSSSDSSVAEVDQVGKVKGIKEGKATVAMSGYDKDGMYETYTCEVSVYQPVLSSDKITMIAGTEAELTLKGVGAFADVTWSSSDTLVASYFKYGGTVAANTKGTAVITAEVCGKKLTCEVTVIAPYLEEELFFLAKGKTANIKIKDLPKDCKISYESGDGKVASVSKSGKITAKGSGCTQVSADLGGRKLTCHVIVADTKVTKALQAAYDAVGSKYSTSKRMQEGYYDCSSLVWRSYKKAGVSIGSSGYAPTAAEMARYLVNNKKVVSYEMVDADKLKPGDLFFYGGDSSRYMGISHVAIYCGSYQTQSYWPFYGEEGTVDIGIIIEAGSAGVAVHTTTLNDYSGVILIGRPV